MTIKARRVNGTGKGFVPLQNDADATMDNTAQSVAIIERAMRLRIVNRGASTEHIRIAFGTSAANAEAGLTMTGSPTTNATTGLLIPAAVSTADQTGYVEIIDIPANATHYAIANAVDGDTQVVSITQGA